MSEVDPEFWEKARRAQQKLIDQFLDYEDIVLIDIGYASEEADVEEPPLALRIHATKRWHEAKPEERVTLPSSIDGIPVVVLRGDYGFS